MNSVKEKRVEIVNSIIEKISQTKRNFFKHKDTLGRVIIKNNRLWWVDEYTRKEVYFHQSTYHGFPGFSHGGTLKYLVFGEFKKFIMEGPIDEQYTGLNAWYWGIPDEEIKELKSFAKSKGYLI